MVITIIAIAFCPVFSALRARIENNSHHLASLIDLLDLVGDSPS
ncbi:hypothetical protein [Okeania sp. SIO3I5]|nr:hypothetical protein [Okeania sp. SIO3I5]